MKNKVFSGSVVLFVLIIGLCIFITACGGESAAGTPAGDDRADNSGNNNSDAPQNDENAGTKTIFYSDGLGDFDFGGYTVRMLTGYGTFGETKTLDVEEENGDTINDAIYRRNREIEERFNVLLTEIGDPSIFNVTNLISRSVRSGDDAYDMALMIDRDAFNLVCSGNYFYPMDELTHVNLDNPWWDQNARRMVSIGGKLYFTYGDESLPYFEYMCLLVFNKDMIQAHGLANPYELVRNGKWTIDKMYEMAQAVTADLNGDGIYDDNDRIGIIEMDNYYYPSFWISDNVLFIDKDENDIPFFNVPGNQKMFAIMDKLYDYAQGNSVFNFFRQKRVKYTEPDHIMATAQMFTGGDVLFANSSIKMLTDLRSAFVDLGIIPYPKLDEAHPGAAYGARITGAMPIVVPVTNPDPERISVILEAFSCGSKNYVIPAYYDIVLKNKAIRDVDSEEMLDMMYNNRYIDLGDTLYMQAVRDQYTALYTANKNTFVSTTEKIADSVQKQIDKSVATFGNAE